MTSGGSGRSQMATAVAVALAILSGGGVTSAEAAGLGRLTVQSALGQPLRAEVEVTSVSPDEAESLKARIASPEAFSRVGLQYKEALSGVRMDVENRGGRYFIKVTSSRPINDPFVDLVVELSWASGTFSREYTFLLDPPTQQNANQANRSGNAPVAGAATAAAATGAAASGSNAVRTIDPATGRLVNQERGAQGRSQAASQPAEAKQQPAAQAKGGRDSSSEGGTVTVGQGETLGMIAARVRPASATLDQTIVAIYRTNPTAFIQNNPNLIRQGRTLTIPSEGEIAAIDSTEAGRQLRMAARDFRSYKERMAGTTPEVATGNGSSTASGAISAKVDDERGGQAGSQDRLELSRSEGGKDEQGSAVGARDAEAQVAREAALKEANSRIAELEKNVGALKSMLELKDKSLADLQAQLEKARVAGAQVSGTVAAAATAAADKARDAASKVADKAAAEKAAAEKAVAEKAAQTKAAADKLAAEAKAAADKVAAEKAAAEKAAAEKAAADKAAAEKAAAEKEAADKAAADKAAADKAAAEKAAAEKAAAEQDQSKPAEGADKDAVERAAADAKAEVERVTNGDADKSKDMPKPAPVNDGEEQGGLIEGLSQNSLLLPGLGVAALAAGLGFWMLRRRRREDDGFSDSISADEFSANSLFGTTGGQSVDTMTGASTQITTISESTPTEVDPIAEAEVYIAYGRETQAEEILREALKRQPERQAIRLKLLEIYSGRKDTVAFGQMAREMHDMTGGLNEEWSKVVQMGAALDPDNALYGDGTADLAAPSPVASPAADVGGMAAAGAAAVAAGVAGMAAAAEPQHVEPEAPAVSSPSMDEGLAFDGGYNKPAGEAESKPVQTFQSTRSGPLSAMPGVELPSLDLDAPLDLDEGPSTVTDLNIDTTITESLDMGHASGGEGDGLGAIGLDLSPSTISGPITMSGAASSQWQEMASKLDLASAYVEIGDKEGARELLEEVINGGDAAQQQRARELLADL